MANPRSSPILNLKFLLLRRDPHNFSSLLSAFRNFVIISTSQGNWVDRFRMMQLLIERERYDDFDHFTHFTRDDSPSSFLAGGVMKLMNNIYTNYTPLHIKKSALSILEDIFLNDLKWGKDRRVKIAALYSLFRHATDGNSMTEVHRAFYQCLKGLSSKVTDQLKE